MQTTVSIQLSLFGDSLTTLASFGEPIALGMGNSNCCNEELEIHTFTSYSVNSWNLAELRRNGISYVLRDRTRLLNPSYNGRIAECSFAYCAYCESTCDGCNFPLGSDRDRAMCSNCESCSECCECFYCESCEEMFSHLASCNEHHCESCCECEQCRRCNMYVSTNFEETCGSSAYCESCCLHYCGCAIEHEEEDDIETVATFVPDGLFRVGRKFGVELELSDITVSRSAAITRSTGLECWDRGYTHEVSDTAWKSLEDGSSGVSAEVVSPVLQGEYGLEQLRVVMTALRGNGAKVGHGTGTHVHFDMTGATGKDLAKVARFYFESKEAIDSLHSPSRRNEYYCQPSTSYEIDMMEEADTNDKARTTSYRIDRYRACNMAAFYKYQTIEFRQHRGTLSYRKLKAWIAFCDALITAALRGYDGTNDLAALLCSLEQCGLSQSDSAYLWQRSIDLAA